ncbi:MAG TPA: GNAT family N-acetyltransferase [Thermomicrobiales bacterium]|nr:GNAT family N-acetyltransferase [Thermomicrobiales bacterium]
MILSRQTMTHAIEENGAEFLLAMGRAAGAEERRTPAIHWVIGGSPIDYHNAVVHADLAAGNIDATILATIERFQAHGVPGTWHVGPAMRPADLGVQLVSHGFIYGGDDVGMAVPLDALNEAWSVPSGLRIERVADERALAAWTSVLARGFGEGAREAHWVRGVVRRIGLDAAPWRHFVGYLDTEPVATATLFAGAGAVGVYFVSTLPDARREGIGAALTLAALRAGREMGERIGVLAASNLGFPVYKRLGFEEYCRIGLYEWRPAVPEAES